MVYTIIPCWVTVAGVFKLDKAAAGEKEASFISTLCTSIKMYFVTVL